MTKQNTTLRFDTPALFIPSVVRGITDAGAPTGLLNFNDVDDRNIGTTSSFRYDSPGSGLRSTQQVGLDWSKFENHTFFQSARVNVHLAFDKIINNFPFDGTRKEIEEFLDSLTGFQKYVYDTFPKNKGYLFFSGSSDISGTYIEVPDFAGSVYPSISSNRTGDSVLNPELGSFSWEMQLYLPDITNDNQTVCQKLSGTYQGVSLFVSQSAATGSADLIFTAVSASSQLQATATVNKGRFNHVVATFNRKPGQNKLELYVNELLSSTSSNQIEFGDIDFNVSSFLIGSGSEVSMGGTSVFTPAETLSGALDEFRFFHDVRRIEDQKAYAQKGIFQTPELKLYYKFNEPSGTLGTGATDRVVIDYSGNSLHALISENGYNENLRITSSIENPLIYENLFYSPVLFPLYGEIVSFNADLVFSASSYDISNPNLITRLIPPHYFIEGQAEEAFESVDGTLVDAYTGETIPGSGEIGQAQIIQSLLFIWAQYFDEMKIILDAFAKTRTVSYDGFNSIPDQLLPKLAEFKGFVLPNLFSGASFDQFIDAENLLPDYTKSEDSLQNIQNKIWRRILVNLNDIISSKGTIHSVKAFIRTLGIDPDSNFRIREYGGPTRKNLSDQRETRTEVSTMLDMSGSDSLIISPYLVAHSKNEPGFPE